MGSPISVVVERGDVVESRHRVHAVAVRNGKVVEGAGDTGLVSFLRSAAKPLQALPLAVDHPELPVEELAIACASHEAREEQLAAVSALLARAEAGPDDLECGPESGSRLRHNCSGKHAGMLLRAHAKSWPREGYRLADHPIQRELHELVARAAGLKPTDVPTGIDGCGVVAYAMSLEHMASAFSRLVLEELDGGGPIIAAMRAKPDLIGGPQAADSMLMRAVDGTIAKRGAEGILCAGLADGTGVALKVEDGANRAAGPAIGRFLSVESLLETEVTNSRNEQAGRVFPACEKTGSGFPQVV
jgi:L-asparaginase II